MVATITHDVDDGVATVTIENRGKRNALSPAMCEQLAEDVAELGSMSQVRVIVFRGAGEKVFSSGFDIEAFATVDPLEGDDYIAAATNAVRECPQPTIAQIGGDVFGGAVELITACDLRVAADDARVGVPVAKMGLLYSARAVRDLVDLIGPSQTKALLFTATTIDAERAAAIGLFDWTATSDELSKEVYELVDDIRNNSPLSITRSKQVVDLISKRSQLSAADKRWARELMEEVATSEDHQEALAAFDEGREPTFTDVDHDDSPHCD